jgi:hypothetical protein
MPGVEAGTIGTSVGGTVATGTENSAGLGRTAVVGAGVTTVATGVATVGTGVAVTTGVGVLWCFFGVGVASTHKPFAWFSGVSGTPGWQIQAAAGVTANKLISIPTATARRFMPAIIQVTYR